MTSYLRPLLYLYKIMTGLKAFVVQNYTEANVKNGLQFEASFDAENVGGGNTVYFVFRTTTKPALIKARVISFTGPKITARVYEGPTFTGTPTSDDIYNMTRINPQPTTVEILPAATVSDPGEEIGAPTYTYGSEGQGNRSLGTFAVEGVERNLAANETYLLAVTNNDAQDHSFSGYVTWYEGEPDLPIQEGAI